MKRKREIIFIITGICLLVITVGFVIYSMRFLVKNATEVLSLEAGKIPEITQFDLIKFKTIKKTKLMMEQGFPEETSDQTAAATQEATTTEELTEEFRESD